MNVLKLAECSQQKAQEIIEGTRVIQVWEGIGAKVNLMDSLRTGLLTKHRDINFHIYTSSLSLHDGFRAMAELAEDTSVKKIECVNSLYTVEAYVEWHTWYQDMVDELRRINMVRIRESSRYDGYLERVAERVSAVMTDEMKLTILTLKNETPDMEKITGVEYYQAVIRDGIRSYPESEGWRGFHPVMGVMEWIP